MQRLQSTESLQSCEDKLAVCNLPQTKEISLHPRKELPRHQFWLYETCCPNGAVSHCTRCVISSRCQALRCPRIPLTTALTTRFASFPKVGDFAKSVSSTFKTIQDRTKDPLKKVKDPSTFEVPSIICQLIVDIAGPQASCCKQITTMIRTSRSRSMETSLRLWTAAFPGSYCRRTT